MQIQIPSNSNTQHKNVERIYYQVPVYKNRGGCCYSHYLHRWWVGCGKPTKGSAPTSGNIVVLTRVPIPTVVGPERKEHSLCQTCSVGTGGALHMQFCSVSISEMLWSRMGGWIHQRPPAIRSWITRKHWYKLPHTQCYIGMETCFPVVLGFWGAQQRWPLRHNIGNWESLF